MPSVEELLSQNSDDEYADISPINDVITIDPETRTINLPASETLFGTEQEMDVERKYFKCPKIVGDNIDLSKHQIYITYVTARDNMGTFLPEEELGLYYCEDMNVDETGNYITFSWLLSGNVLSKEGFIAFSVSAKHMDGEVLKTRWKTKPAVGTVLMTVPDGASQIVEAYPDIIAQLFNRMNAAEEIATELGKNLAKEKTDREQADISLQKDMSGKLSEPVEGLAVGKYFRVAQIDENGHAVLEAVDAKTIGVQDVQVNGDSIVNVENGVADLPNATNNTKGVVRGNTSIGNSNFAVSGGSPYCITRNASDFYSQGESGFVSNGTLRNVLTAPSLMPSLTADEQAAARERMGIGDYELIEEITLTEDVKSIFRTAEPNGESYNFKSIYFEMEIPANISHTNVWWYIKNGSNMLAFPNRPVVKKPYVSYHHCGAIREKGFITGWIDSANILPTKDGGLAQIYKNHSIFTDLPITDIEIKASDTFVSGEIFRIYGVRA